MESLAAMLGSLGASVFRWAALTFVVINGLALVAFFVTRDRSLVNRWTSRLVAADLFLIGAGAGIPAVAFGLKSIVNAVSVSQNTEVRLTDK